MKQAARLRDSRERRRTGRLLVDGARESLRALAAGVAPVEAFVLDDPSANARTAEALAELQRRGVDVFPTARDAFDKLAYGDRSDGVVLVARAAPRTLADLVLPDRPLVAVLAGLEKPGNVGAILRTADGAGVDAVVVADPRVDLFNPNTIRASVGAVFRDNVAAADGGQTRRWLAEQRLQPIATRPDAATPYTRADLAGRVAIVLGSEAEGLPPEWDTAPGVLGVSLPMLGVADSLNVAAAAAVLFYEARRQRSS
ncbi:TrmH family RNA methyltransferase [Botrimarina sp.]|uniref:TrmH family RNA methyltransferase n=1 Tax=Botrimarina sp. TaxID=2795802 RepID=UPI0032EB9248